MCPALLPSPDSRKMNLLQQRCQLSIIDLYRISMFEMAFDKTHGYRCTTHSTAPTTSVPIHCAHHCTRHCALYCADDGPRAAQPVARVEQKPSLQRDVRRTVEAATETERRTRGSRQPCASGIVERKDAVRCRSAPCSHHESSGGENKPATAE